MAGIAAVCFAATAVIGVFAAEDLVHLVRGFTERRGVISSAHYAAASLVLVPMGIGLGLLFLLSKPATPEEMKRAAGSKLTGVRRLLLFVVASLVAALVAPAVQYGIVDSLASRRGYRSCPTPDWPRHQPDRWAAADGQARCPGNGVDPNQ